MERKYTNYEIKVTFENGETELINISGINTSSYKDMIKVYRDIKEDYKNESCIIKFLGRNNLNEVKVLWSKNNTQKNNTTANQSFNECIKEALEKCYKDLNKCVNRAYRNHLECLEMANMKKIDIALHKAEYLRYGIGEREEILDEIIDLREERRKIKNSKMLYHQMKSIYDDAKFYVNNFKELEECSPELINNFVNSKSQIFEEVNFELQDKNELLTTLSEKYTKVIVDEYEKKMFCYNNCKKAFKRIG